MSGGGLQNPTRQLGGNTSFAQSLSGSQPATPLDLSYVFMTSSPLKHHPFSIHPHIVHTIHTNCHGFLLASCETKTHHKEHGPAKARGNNPPSGSALCLCSEGVLML